MRDDLRFRKSRLETSVPEACWLKSEISRWIWQNEVDFPLLWGRNREALQAARAIVLDEFEEHELTAEAASKLDNAVKLRRLQKQAETVMREAHDLLLEEDAIAAAGHGWEDAGATPSAASMDVDELVRVARGEALSGSSCE